MPKCSAGSRPSSLSSPFSSTGVRQTAALRMTPGPHPPRHSQQPHCARIQIAGAFRTAGVSPAPLTLPPYRWPPAGAFDFSLVPLASSALFASRGFRGASAFVSLRAFASPSKHQRDPRNDPQPRRCAFCIPTSMWGAAENSPGREGLGKYHDVRLRRASAPTSPIHRESATKSWSYRTYPGSR